MLIDIVAFADINLCFKPRFQMFSCLPNFQPIASISDLGGRLRQDRELKRFQKYTSSVYKGTANNVCMGCPKYGDVEAELTGNLKIATLLPGTTKDKANFIRDGSGKIIGP